MQRLPVKNEHLRLILSKDHGKWLDHEIRDRRIAIAVLLLLMVVGIISLYTFFTDQTDIPAEISIIYMDHDSTEAEKKSIKEQGFTVVLKNPDGSIPAAYHVSSEVGLLQKSLNFASLILMFLSPFLIFFIGKACSELVTLHKWKEEHEEFLSSHNRASAKK